jgi:hypothetical protein
MIRYHAVHQDAMAADPDGKWVCFSEASSRNAEQRARIAELEAKLERCVRLAASLSLAGATIADVRAAIETPAIGERREGGQ